MKTVHGYNIIFPCTKQGNKLNHTFVSHNFMLSNITRDVSDNEKNRILILSHALGVENLNRVIKMFLCKINFQCVETYFCYTMKLFFYTIKKLLQDEKVFLHDDFLYKIKNIFPKP